MLRKVGYAATCLGDWFANIVGQTRRRRPRQQKLRNSSREPQLQVLYPIKLSDLSRQLGALVLSLRIPLVLLSFLMSTYLPIRPFSRRTCRRNTILMLLRLSLVDMRDSERLDWYLVEKGLRSLSMMERLVLSMLRRILLVWLWARRHRSSRSRTNANRAKVLLYIRKPALMA